MVEFITADNGSDTPTTASTVEKKYTKALLYRGTPENPAFWKRVMFDLPLAAGECIVMMCIHLNDHVGHKANAPRSDPPLLVCARTHTRIIFRSSSIISNIKPSFLLR